MGQVAAKLNILPPPYKWRQMKKGNRCKLFCFCFLCFWEVFSAFLVFEKTSHWGPREEGGKVTAKPNKGRFLSLSPSRSTPPLSLPLRSHTWFLGTVERVTVDLQGGPLETEHCPCSAPYLWGWVSYPGVSPRSSVAAALSYAEGPLSDTVTLTIKNPALPQTHTHSWLHLYPFEINW